jgi:LysR family transcriptional regulator, hypochlorite-specific transcription factor HypT
MELKWLEDFVCLADIGSFWKASEARHVSQPALSRRIRALEDWLGVTLFDRSTYPITLTSFGRQFLPYAQDMLRTSKGIREEFRLLAGARADEVRVATLHTLSTHLLPAIVARLQAVRPNAKAIVIPSIQGVEHHFDALANGIYHVLVTYGGTPISGSAGRIDDLEEKRVGSDELVPVASPALFERAGLASFDRATDVPFLNHASFSFTEKLVGPLVRSLEGRLRVVAESGLSETLAAMARLGLGFAWLPRSILEADLAAGALEIVGGPDLRVPLSILAYRRRAPGSPVVEALWSVLEEPEMDRPPPPTKRAA